jgi:2-iminobutanoate/2-iminopropanoate deaminase
MLIRHNPKAMPQPVSVYSQGVEVPSGARWLYVSGQVGALPDGRMAEGFEAQAEQTWHNLLAVLGDAGMGVADLVKVNALLLRNEDYPVYNRIRTRFLGNARPASTALVVPVLANPEWLFELDAVAARA